MLAHLGAVAVFPLQLFHCPRNPHARGRVHAFTIKESLNRMLRHSGLTHESAEGKTSCSANDYGTVFQLKLAMNGEWKLSVVHSFKDHPGSYPLSSLLIDQGGNLYATTEGDGKQTWGSVFEFVP